MASSKKKFYDFLNLSETISVIFLILLFFSVLYEVFARSVFGKPTIWANEFVGYFLVSAAYIGSSHTLRNNKHLIVDLLLLRLSKKKKLLLECIANFISLIFCILVVFYGFKLVQISYLLGVVSVSELRIPLWIPKLVIPLSFILLSLEFANRIKKQIYYFKSK
jgi:TRAP-type C4-dicarboxylate transport system permease small subunit